MARQSLPWFKFFPDAWTGDTRLRSCDLAAKGAWIELIIGSWSMPRPGFFTHGDGEPLTEDDLVEYLMTAQTDRQIIADAVRDLVANKVLKQDENGVFYCRRIASLFVDVKRLRKKWATDKKGQRMSTKTPRGLHADSTRTPPRVQKCPPLEGERDRDGERDIDKSVVVPARGEKPSHGENPEPRPVVTTPEAAEMFGPDPIDAMTMLACRELDSGERTAVHRHDERTERMPGATIRDGPVSAQKLFRLSLAQLQREPEFKFEAVTGALRYAQSIAQRCQDQGVFPHEPRRQPTNGQATNQAGRELRGDALRAYKRSIECPEPPIKFVLG